MQCGFLLLSKEKKTASVPKYQGGFVFILFLRSHLNGSVAECH